MYSSDAGVNGVVVVVVVGVAVVVVVCSSSSSSSCSVTVGSSCSEEEVSSSPCPESVSSSPPPPSGEFPEGEPELPDQEQMIATFELIAAAPTTTTPSTAATTTSTNTTAATTTTTTPSPVSSEQPQQQLVQSAGGLTATINANNITTGDTITVNGTVADRAGFSYITISIVDPRGEFVELDRSNYSSASSYYRLPLLCEFGVIRIYIMLSSGFMFSIGQERN